MADRYGGLSVAAVDELRRVYGIDNDRAIGIRCNVVSVVLCRVCGLPYWVGSSGAECLGPMEIIVESADNGTCEACREFAHRFPDVFEFVLRAFSMRERFRPERAP